MEKNNLTLGQIVAANYKSATVFEKYNIDFCCMGNRNFGDACQVAGLDANVVARELLELEKVESANDYGEWPLDSLADHILKKHHQYIEQVTPTIKNLLNKICNVHSINHPELLEIRDIFNSSSGELAMHMKKEELILFPFIKKLVHTTRSLDKSKLFNSVSEPIGKMQDDHSDEGKQLMRMAELSNNFTPPKDACFSFITTYQMLKEYEKDMHLHIHLENNILFPGAISLEAELISQN